jgi:HJR/Mrr/RecB family endonuclease
MLVCSIKKALPSSQLNCRSSFSFLRNELVLLLDLELIRCSDVDERGRNLTYSNFLTLVKKEKSKKAQMERPMTPHEREQVRIKEQNRLDEEQRLLDKKACEARLVANPPPTIEAREGQSAPSLEPASKPARLSTSSIITSALLSFFVYLPCYIIVFNVLLILCIFLPILGIPLVGAVGWYLYKRDEPKREAKRKLEEKRYQEQFAKEQKEHQEKEAQRKAEAEARQKVYLREMNDYVKLSSLRPFEFERCISDLYRRFGFTVRQTAPTGDGGKDAILWKGGEKYLLECKKYSTEQLVGRPEVQKFHSALITENAQLGFFVTTSGFSKGAEEYVKKYKLPIELIDMKHLSSLIMQAVNS